MDNFSNNLKQPTHTVELKDRKVLALGGVKSIDSFDSQEFLVDTVNGHLHVKGSGLVLGKMDIDNGEVVIKGTIDSLSYISKKAGGEQRKGLAQRLFK